MFASSAIHSTGLYWCIKVQPAYLTLNPFVHTCMKKTYTLTPFRALAVNIIPSIRAMKNTDTSPHIANEHVWSLLSTTRFESFLNDSVKSIQQRRLLRSTEETPRGTLLMEEVLSFLDLILTCSLVKLPNEMTARTQRMARGTTMDM